MRMNKVIAALLMAMFALVSVSSGADYFVSKQGNDANTGLSKSEAFLTIQKGVDALEAGDTLVIAPGEYFENVKRVNLGNADVDTVIRAEVPGTALLRGDIPSPKFEKVDGYRFIYAAKIDQEPKLIMEHNRVYALFPRPNVPELEFNPGGFHYNSRSKTLYISNPDLAAPDHRRYTLSMNGECGLAIHHAKRIVIDGLAATGFYPGWGILLGEPVSCTVRNCVSFMNVGGIVLEPIKGVGGGEGGSNNLIENCVAYGNTFGGIVRYGANNDIIRNCHTYRNSGAGGENFGVMHYAGMTGPLLIKNIIAWGQSFDFSVKPGGQQERLENCVGLGYIRIAPNKMAHNLFNGGNEYDRGASETPANTVLFTREGDVDRDFEYADSLNLDFRLQPDSRFRATGSNDMDRGPYPYQANIFYVSPRGDDKASGLSMRAPWRTLSRSVENLHPGDTLYLTEGKYEAAALENVGDDKYPVRILGRGRGTVVITGNLPVTNGTGIVFERVNFDNSVIVADSRHVTFKNCTFFGSAGGLDANNVKGLEVNHSVFVRVPLSLTSSEAVSLSGNIYANTDKPAVQLDSASAIRYSDYNDYQDTAHCWNVDGTTWSFAALQKQHDVYSQTLLPELAMKNGAPALKDDHRFQSVGPNSTALGIHHEYNVSSTPLEVIGPFVHSVSATTANIEWWSTSSARLSLAWGETQQMKHSEHDVGSKRFNTYSLSGLEPGTTYYFKLAADDNKGKVMSFTTDAKAADPRTYYVAPDGDDANDGLCRDKAFQTICRAAERVAPGDTVMIAAGEYNETIRLRAAGTRERPITFRSISGEKPAIIGAIEVIAKPDNHFDGLYFTEEGVWRSGFDIQKSPRVHITRCLQAQVSVDLSPEMVIRNSVLHGGWLALGLSRSPGSIIENNVFIMTILRQVQCDSPIILRRNIFCECIRGKCHQTLLDLRQDLEETDNCFYLRWPPEEKLAVNDTPLAVYCARTGSNSFAANPMMRGTVGFRTGWQTSSSENFDEFFSTNPKLILRDIGLQPSAFSDFNLGVSEWPYDRAWAEAFTQASDAASALAKAGNNKAALKAYEHILKQLPLADRLKSDVLEKAFFCAEKMKDYDRALKLAEAIPIEVLSTRAQMRVLLATEQYAELLKRFDFGEGEKRYYAYRPCPEREDVIVDIYYLRSQAYIHTGDLGEAETDLQVVNENRFGEQYTSGEAIHDLASLRLGDFYRTQLKDDTRALEEYLKVCDRSTWAPHGTVPKPLSTGSSEVLVQATEAACDILRKQGNTKTVMKLQRDLKKAQADAAAALQNK